MQNKQMQERPRSAPPKSLSRAGAILFSALWGLCAGLIASLLAVVTMGVLFFVAGTPTPPELFGDYVLKHIDVGTFIRLLIMFSPNSKTTPLGLALLAMLAIGTVLGLVYAFLVRVRLPVQGTRPGRREWVVAPLLTLLMTLTGVLLFNDEVRQNHYGLPVLWATVATDLAFLLDFAVYGIALCLLYRLLLPKQAAENEEEGVRRRRQALSRVGVAALGLVSAGGAAGLLRGYLNEYAAYDGVKTVSNGEKTVPITPNDGHYIVTQNTVDPNPSISLWRLDVTGLVKRGGSYTYDEVQRLPSTSRAITLECIANGPGGHLMGTAVWQGVTLKTLLEQHGGAQPEATHVAFYSVDGYTVSLPLKEVLEADALLAWRMNGVEVPQKHGYPMRVLIPGRYGEENPKWLTRVELTDHFVGGLYSDQGWYNGPLHMTSRIDYPRGSVAVGASVEVGGIAYGGDKDVQRVEVSTDDGQTWNDATLTTRLSKDAWVFWTWQWRPQQTGRYTLACRMTNGVGEVQTGKIQGTVPKGSTGYHKVTIEVK